MLQSLLMLANACLAGSGSFALRLSDAGHACTRRCPLAVFPTTVVAAAQFPRGLAASITEEILTRITFRGTVTKK
jgi:hypothetical protein